MVSVVCPMCGCANSEFDPCCTACLARLPHEPAGRLQPLQARHLQRAGLDQPAAPVRLPPRYQALEELGHGSTSIVYRALDTESGRPVALKLLHPDTGFDPAAHSRFLREGRLASALDHPNICRLYEVGEHAGQPFLVLALCEGETLQRRIGRAPIPLREALWIARQLASALVAVHAAGIVHRDLKPANVMLAGSAAKLMDFGFAKLAASGKSATPLTRTGQVLGTLAYMSPEQLRAEPLDALTDLWSLGAVVYEMFAAAPPFQGRTGAAVLQGILHAEPRPIGELRPDAPPGLQGLLGRLLCKATARRIPSAAEALLALEAI
jgi:serine/threonine protein kinase